MRYAKSIWMISWYTALLLKTTWAVWRNTPTDKAKWYQPETRQVCDVPKKGQVFRTVTLQKSCVGGSTILWGASKFGITTHLYKHFHSWIFQLGAFGG